MPSRERRIGTPRAGRARGAGRASARSAFAALLAVALSGCFFWRSDPEEGLPEEQPAHGAGHYFELGEKELEGRRSLFFFHDVDYAQATEYFQEVIDNFPYSDLATEAELRIADIHFDQGKFQEASSYYQDFVELHPNHERVPYAIYRGGLCSFERIRDADRDQGPTREAVAQFQVLLERFPNSALAVDAQRRLGQARDRLSSGDVQVGDYYFGQARYHAAIQRYRRALGAHPEHEGSDRTIARMGLSLARLQRRSEAGEVLRQARRLPLDEETAEQVEEALDSLAIPLPRTSEQRIARSCWAAPNPACETAPAAPEAGADATGGEAPEAEPGEGATGAGAGGA